MTGAAAERPEWRPLIIDLVRAYEGVLLGFVVILLAAIVAGGSYGVLEFGAVLVIPAVLMLVFIHQGAPSRRLFATRAAGALVGWAIIWIVFIPLFIFLAYAVVPGSEQILVYVALALVDGVILGLSMAGVDRLANRGRRPGRVEQRPGGP